MNTPYDSPTSSQLLDEDSKKCTQLMVVFTSLLVSSKAIQDLQDVQARVEERNKKLEDLENRDSSFKDAHSEIIQLQNQLKNARKELQETLKGKNTDLDELKTKMNNLKQEMEKQKLDEILKGLLI